MPWRSFDREPRPSQHFSQPNLALGWHYCQSIQLLRRSVKTGEIASMVTSLCDHRPQILQQGLTDLQSFCSGQRRETCTLPATQILSEAPLHHLKWLRTWELGSLAGDGGKRKLPSPSRNGNRASGQTKRGPCWTWTRPCHARARMPADRGLQPASNLLFHSIRRQDDMSLFGRLVQQSQ